MSAFFSKQYSYRKGTVNRGVSAQTVGEVLEGLDEITPEAFLDASRDEDSPTHRIFTWDDSVAAEKYRLQEAKSIINAIVLDIVPAEQEVSEVEVTIVKEAKTPAYVNVNKKQFGIKAHYVPLEVAMTNEEMRCQVLENALTELKSFQNKYERLTELSEVFDAINNAIANHEPLEEEKGA